MSLKFPDAETVLEEDDYRRMESVEELKETLEEETGEELSLKESYEKASEEWWRLRRKFVEPERTGELPGDCVNVAGTDFHVHGIAHGPLRNYVNMERVSGQVADYVMQSVDSWEDERKHVYFEQNLVALPLAFGSPEKETYHRLEDMGDIRAFTREKADIEIDSDPISGLERLKKKVKWAAKHRLRHILSRAVKRMESEQQPIPRDVDRFTTLDRAMQDPSYIRDLQDLSRAENLPLELERDYGRKFSDQKIINVERSIYQANYAVSDALSHPGQEAHMVIGGGHHSHVVERLKELSNRWDVHSIEPETDTVLEE